MRSVLILLVMVFLAVPAAAQQSKQNYEIMRLIRQEKFELVLPGAMRDNNIDIWVHVVESGRMDPLALDLGGWTEYRSWEPVCYYVFVDHGDRIERIILGGEDIDGLYDHQGSYRELLSIIEQRDPDVIAVNMSDSYGIANGLSHTEYLRLRDTLGDKYSGRLTSAENLITDFRVRRVQREILAFSDALEIQRQVMEASFKSIEPDRTTRKDAGWSAADRLLEQGIGPGYHAATLFLPYMPSVQTRKGPNSDLLVRGSLIAWDMGIAYLNFATDIKRHGYILDEGETDMPAGLKRAWESGKKIRSILKRTLEVGRTAGETHETMVAALEAAGFISTPSDDRSSQYRDLMLKLRDSDKVGFTIDFHTTGNTSVSDAALGAQIAPWRSDRAHLMIQPNHIFAFEFFINAWVPEWGRRITIGFEENAIVTDYGVEYLSPPEEEIFVIR